MCSNIVEINKLIEGIETENNIYGQFQEGHRHKTLIVQDYIRNPLLINKRKFDIRVYALLTSCYGKIKGYFFEDGYLRTSSREFTLKDLSNKFIHLTNDAIQKKADNYGKFENSNKLSYPDFQKYLESSEFTSKYAPVNFMKDLLP